MLKMNRHFNSAGTSFLVGGLAPPKNFLTQHGNSTLRSGGFGKLAAVPYGYGRPGYGLAPCDTPGGMSSFTLCVGTGTATGVPAAGIGITGTSTGVGETSATIKGLAWGTGTAPGSCTVTGSMMGFGIISGTVSGAATVSGDIFAAVAITGLAEGSSSATGDGYLAISLTGEANGSSTVYGSAAALVNTSGAAAGSGSIFATITGAYFASGTASGVGSAVGGDALGLGWVNGTAAGSSTATLESFALGFMDGSTATAGGDVTLGGISNVITSALSQDENIQFMIKSLVNRREIKKIGGAWTLVVYDDDGTTPIVSKALKDVSGGEIADLVAGALAQEEASDV